MPLLALALFWIQLLVFRHYWGVGSYLSLFLTAVCSIPGYFVFVWFACLRRNERNICTEAFQTLLLKGRNAVCL
jgi:hypothetical protein